MEPLSTLDGCILVGWHFNNSTLVAGLFVVSALGLMMLATFEQLVLLGSFVMLGYELLYEHSALLVCRK